MKISTWNVNSVRARIDNIKDYLKKNNPDILLMQEIKTEEKNYPFDDFKKLKYESYVFGQKSYNGVAIISKKKLDNVETNFFKDKMGHSRIITTNVKYKKDNFILINIYAPNGNPIGTEKYDYKIGWYNSFVKKIKKLLDENNKIIISGDFNVIPEEIDVYNYKNYLDNALFTIDVRKKYREILNMGFEDIYRYFNDDKIEYTFWDYMSGGWAKNSGMRIDHFLVSTPLLKSVKSCKINKEPRGREKPSDHTPFEIDLA